jgi:membrane protein DedA with SNARE-associated domain
MFDLLLRYGYLVLFLSVFAEQVGLPIPAAPMLLAMGVGAGLGKLSVLACLAVATAGAVLGDLIWYDLGRRRGHAILRLLCKVSLEPDSCVSNTKQKWNRFGGFTLVFAKFVPGLSTVSPPLAGLTRMPLGRFLALDVLGSALWAGAFLGIGFLFRDEMERAAELLQRLGSSLIFLVSLSLALYIAVKYYNRRRFIKELRVARVSPDELMDLMSSGDEVTIIDLRNAAEVEADGTVLPSAIWIDPAKLELEDGAIPRDKEIVLYCS